MRFSQQGTILMDISFNGDEVFVAVFKGQWVTCYAIYN